ncbi:Vitamin B12 transporter BtuB [Alphaproteobacteria bacterium SO-S41]|nr:Vitamin B12 transporter BtuB [Alphaproteobacteria bacterium SO-S41]
MSRNSMRVGSIGVGFALSLVTVAGAQSKPAPEKVDEQVVVTATKRKESVQDVPISMNVFRGAALRDAGVTDVKELTASVPGVGFAQSATIPVISMRGFAGSPSNPAYDPAVTLYWDGIYAGRARQLQTPFFDIARVEVLRGPQGALLGKNTAAGAISFVTAEPTQELSAGLDTMYLFDREGVDVFGFVSGEIAPTLTARLALKYNHTNEGWLKNKSFGGRGDPRFDSIAGRFTLAWEPSENFRSIFRYERTDFEQLGWNKARLPSTVIPLEDQVDWVRDVANPQGQQEGVWLKPWQAVNEATWEFGGGYSLVSVTGYSAYKAESYSGAGAMNPEPLGSRLIEDFDQFSQELRVLSPTDGRFNWVAGLYYDTSNYDTDYTVRSIADTALSDPYTVLALFRQDGDTLSAYATGTFDITEAFSATVGLRWTHTEKHADYGQTVNYEVGIDPGITPAPGVINRVMTGDISTYRVDPSISLEYKITPDIMVYAAYSRGSKSGAFQNVNRTAVQAQFKLEPEASENYEVGLRSQWGDWLTANISIFQLTVDNLQTGQFVGAPPVLLNVNAGRARTKGIEWTLNARPSDYVTINFNGSYTTGKYLEYMGAPCTYYEALAGCTSAAGGANAAGRPLTLPKWTFSLSANVRVPLSDNLELTFIPEVTYRSSASIDAGGFNPFWGFQDATLKTNVRLGIGSPNDTWELALVGRNIFNELTVNSVYQYPGVGIVPHIDEGRNIGLQLSLRY